MSRGRLRNRTQYQIRAFLLLLVEQVISLGKPELAQRGEDVLGLGAVLIEQRIYKPLRRVLAIQFENLLDRGAGLLHPTHIVVSDREPGKELRRFGIARTGALKRRDRPFASTPALVVPMKADGQVERSVMMNARICAY